MDLLKLSLRAVALWACACLATPGALAQGVRIVNAFPPGGPSDIISPALGKL